MKTKSGVWVTTLLISALGVMIMPSSSFLPGQQRVLATLLGENILNDQDAILQKPDQGIRGFIEGSPVNQTKASEICDNDVDDDGNGLADANDPDCGPAPPVSEICDNDVDDDGNGLADANDPDCGPAPPASEICDNDVDDDGDGLADANDSDCVPTTQSSTEGNTKNLEDIQGYLEEDKLFIDRILPIIEKDLELAKDSIKDGQLDPQLLPQLEIDMRLLQDVLDAFNHFALSRNISYSQCILKGDC